jgi:hypothetical protein
MTVDQNMEITSFLVKRETLTALEKSEISTENYGKGKQAENYDNWDLMSSDF